MHDGARIHRVQIIRDWLRENEITTFKQPPYSLDLNPIKHLWHRLKERLYKRFLDLIDFRGGVEVVRDEIAHCVGIIWPEIKEWFLVNLVESIDRRIEAVIRA